MVHSSPTHHRATLSVTAERVPPGGSATLQWSVVGVEANVASVHLTSDIDGGPSMIECAASQGAREVIFTRPGNYTFSLTATFGDGSKITRQVSVIVEDRGEGSDTLTSLVA
jgi:hypothetical protein